MVPSASTAKDGRTDRADAVVEVLKQTDDDPAAECARARRMPACPSHLPRSYLPRARCKPPPPRPKSCNSKQRSLPPSLLLHSHPPWRFAKIMSTCSMQKAKSYLPTRGGGGGPGRQAVRLRHGHSAVSVRIQEEEVHARGREGRRG